MKRGSARVPAIILIALLIVGAGAYGLYRADEFSRTPAFLVRMFYPLDHVDEIAASAERHQVNPYLVAAVINVESDFRSGAESGAGAIGLMQILPTTAADMARWGVVDGVRYPLEDLADPAVNIEYGTAYLRYLVERYHEIDPALAAYNAGLGNADEWVAQGSDVRDFVDFPETHEYIQKVNRAKARYEELYPDTFAREEN